MIKTDQYSEIEAVYFVVKLKTEIKLLYKQLSSNTSNKDIQNMLIYLSSEQDIKIIWIKTLLYKLKEYKTISLHPEEYFKYLSEIKDSIINIYKSKYTNQKLTYSKIIKIIFNTYNKFIVYLKEIKNNIINTDNQTINLIIEDEEKYLNKINSMKENTMQFQKENTLILKN